MHPSKPHPLDTGGVDSAGAPAQVVDPLEKGRDHLEVALLAQSAIRTP